MEATTKTLDEVVNSVLNGAAGAHLGICDDGPAPGADRYCAEVTMMGAWCGTLRVQVTPELALDLVAKMLRQPAATLMDLTVMDAIGELTNMIAGNLRPLVTGARCLGIPVVERRACGSIRGVPVLGRAFRRNAERLQVELFAEREQAAL